MDSVSSALANVFGTKPEGCIFLPSNPYQVRFNCKAGQLALSEDDFIGKKAAISIIKASRYYGKLGLTVGEWMQLFYIPAPGCDILPRNTVCVSYIKTRSLSAFQNVVTRMVADGANPALGIFDVSFTQHAREGGNYYSIAWEWRERSGDDETQQLQEISEFMQSNPPLVDMRVTASDDMRCLDGLTDTEIQKMITAMSAHFEDSREDSKRLLGIAA